jgi:hypothetical protein
LFGGTGTAKIHMIAGIQNQLLKSTVIRLKRSSANLAFVPAASQDTQYLLEAGQSLDAAVTPIEIKCNSF